VQEALNNAPEGDGNTHLSSPSHFYPIIQAFLPIPEKTQSNQIARSASIVFNANPSVIVALYPSVIEDALINSNAESSGFSAAMLSSVFSSISRKSLFHVNSHLIPVIFCPTEMAIQRMVFS
jgi:hypothetical protein